MKVFSNSKNFLESSWFVEKCRKYNLGKFNKKKHKTESLVI